MTPKDAAAAAGPVSLERPHESPTVKSGVVVSDPNKADSVDQDETARKDMESAGQASTKRRRTSSVSEEETATPKKAKITSTAASTEAPLLLDALPAEILDDIMEKVSFRKTPLGAWEVQRIVLLTYTGTGRT